MIELPTDKESIERHFYHLSNFYDRKRYPDLKVVYQFALTEKERTYCYYISIASGRAEYREGQHSSPSIKIYAPLSTWFSIANGSLNGLWGLLTGKYRIEGNPYYLKEIKKIFGKKFDGSDIPELSNPIAEFEIHHKRIWKKPDKILVVNGSPRRKEGFTYFYLRHLLEGVKGAGCDVELINIYDESLKIEPCRGCYVCEKGPGKCVIEDDADELLKKVENSYITLYAFPLYTCAPPDKLKTFLNRHYVLVSPYFSLCGKFTRHPKRRRKECYTAVLAIGGYPQIKQFKLAEQVLRLGHGAYVTTPLIAAIFRPGAEELYVNSSCREYLYKVLHALEIAGEELVKNGKVSKSTLRVISKIYIPLRDWHRGTNFFRCFHRLQNP
ncbi:MAG: NAD(P)H-dependent oxidoreductase [Candidatus Omnitrophota bacterium]